MKRFHCSKCGRTRRVRTLPTNGMCLWHDYATHGEYVKSSRVNSKPQASKAKYIPPPRDAERKRAS